MQFYAGHTLSDTELWGDPSLDPLGVWPVSDLGLSVETE